MVHIHWTFLALSAASDDHEYEFGAFPYSELKANFRGFPGDRHVTCKKHTAGDTVEPEVDWESIMAPIKDQAGCGSCHIFAAVAVTESSAHVDLGKSVVLSEQQVVDCASKDYDALKPNKPDEYSNYGGCGGGWPSVSLKYFTASGVEAADNPAKCACSQNSYPYLGDDKVNWPRCNETTGKQCWHWHEGVLEGKRDVREPLPQGCKVDECECALPSGSVENCYEITGVNGSSSHVAALKEALSQRPIAVAVNGHLLGDSSGRTVVPAEKVKCDDKKKQTQNHAVVAVGYGTDADGTEYWKIRNSYGEGWRENGYVRVEIVDDELGSACLNLDGVLGVYPKMIASPPPTPIPPIPKKYVPFKKGYVPVHRATPSWTCCTDPSSNPGYCDQKCPTASASSCESICNSDIPNYDRKCNSFIVCSNGCYFNEENFRDLNHPPNANFSNDKPDCTTYYRSDDFNNGAGEMVV